MSCARWAGCMVAMCAFASAHMANAADLYPAAHAPMATDSEMKAVRDRVGGWLESPSVGAAPPFSFTYGGETSGKLLGEWLCTREAATTDRPGVRAIVWRDPATGFEVRCECTVYTDYPAIDWVVYFKNTGTVDSPLIENVRALDIRAPLVTGSDPILHHAKGTNCSPTDFAPLSDPVPAGSTVALGSHGRGGNRGGLPSVEAMPFFDLETAEGGMLFALGWSGPWAAEFARTEPTALAVRAGTEPMRVTLRPGEAVRGPRVVMLFWQGNRLRGHNMWRRFLLDHYSPTPGGKPFHGLIADGNWGSWMNAERHIQELSWWGDHKLPMECYWIDAGLTDMSQGWEAHQSHQVPNAELFPGGMKAISDAAHERGMKFLLWMVPGSVHPAVGVGKEHPEWLGESFTHKDYGSMVFYGLDHGQPPINQWMIEHFTQVVREFGVDIFRQDGGNLWPADTEANRQGMSQLKYIEGFYAFWDGLLRNNPGLLIDNCAEGGRKIDIETIRRSIVLWRSDCQASGDFDPAVNQGFNYSLAQWIPLCGGVVTVSTVSTYSFRSAYCPALLLGWPMAPVADVAQRWAKVDVELLRKLLEEYVAVRPCLFGDFYPLTPYSAEQNAWVAWQFDRPDLEQGLIQAFRRPQASENTITLKLHGLVADATYALTNGDTAATTRLTGRALMENGLAIAAPEAPSAPLFTYRREQ